MWTFFSIQFCMAQSSKKVNLFVWRTRLVFHTNFLHIFWTLSFIVPVPSLLSSSFLSFPFPFPSSTSPIFIFFLSKKKGLHWGLNQRPRTSPFYACVRLRKRARSCAYDSVQRSRSHLCFDCVAFAQRMRTWANAFVQRAR